MQSRKHSAPHYVSTLLAMAGHTMMGTALGLAFSLGLITFDASGVSKLIAHSIDPRSSALIFAGTFTLIFAVGATLTGFAFSMMERDQRSKRRQ